MRWLAMAGAAVAGVIVSAAPARADGDREAGHKMLVNIGWSQFPFRGLATS